MTPLAPFPQALAGWQNFYLLTGAAAATLTGLMFVAVTFGSSLVTKETAQMARAFLDPTYLHFVQVVFTACLLTIPTMSAGVLGAVLVAVACVRLGGLVWVFKRFQAADRKHSDIELSDWIISIFAPAICHALLLLTGTGLCMGAAVALTGLAIVTMSLLIVGIHGAWELLVWMAMAVSEKRRGSS